MVPNVPMMSSEDSAFKNRICLRDFKTLVCLFSNVFGFRILCEGRELKFVQAIWRHGDRSPSKVPYPNDKYDEKYWPTGWSQLTELGAEQMEELGTFFRERYINTFVNSTFRSNQIFIQSSDSDRALSSAQAFLNGMFLLNNCNLKKRPAPVPVHSTGVGIDDFLLKPTSADCPAYDQHFETSSADLLTSISQRYKDLYEFLGNVTGFGPNIKTDQVAGINNIQREIAHNLTQPDWVYRVWPMYGNSTTLELLKKIDQETRINEFDDDKLSKLRGGYLLGDWVNRAKKVARGDQKEPSKMILYSAHDGTLLSLLYSLDIGDGEQIPYAAAVIMEIYEADNGDFETEIYYRKNRQVLQKTVPGCSQKCEVEKLIELTKENAVYSQNDIQQ
ncbi:hypothetical protein FO519_009323, partial [Halicephalobus sp. NKZ332]